MGREKEELSIFCICKTDKVRLACGRLTGTPQAFLPLSFQALKQKSKLVTPKPSVTHKQPDWADEGGSKLEWGMRALSSAVTSDPSDGDIYKTLEPEWTPALLQINPQMDVPSICPAGSSKPRTGASFP